MSRTSLLILVVFFLLYACSEEYDLNITNSDRRIVLAGAITNEMGPYFFKISLSNDLSSEGNEGITDALCVISDNEGITDTLKLLPTTIQRHPKWYYSFITIKKYSGVIDTIRLLGGDTTTIKGIYYTTKIQGRPENIYSLKIIYKNSIIQATEEMPSVSVIDSVQFREQFLEKDGQNYYVPFLFFKEPKDQTNFYMFNFGSDNLYNLIYGTAQVWNFSILSDKYLKDYVSGFNLDDGASPVGQEDFFYFNKGDKAKIRMLSLTESAYNYYKALLEQFENDGGAYSPTPASPPTNLTGNALGYFRASAVSEIDLVVK